MGQDGLGLMMRDFPSCSSPQAQEAARKGMGSDLLAQLPNSNHLSYSECQRGPRARTCRRCWRRCWPMAICCCMRPEGVDGRRGVLSVAGLSTSHVRGVLSVAGLSTSHARGVAAGLVDVDLGLSVSGVGLRSGRAALAGRPGLSVSTQRPCCVERTAKNNNHGRKGARRESRDTADALFFSGAFKNLKESRDFCLQSKRGLALQWDGAKPHGTLHCAPCFFSWHTHIHRI
jgi:hypothetical protein